MSSQLSSKRPASDFPREIAEKITPGAPCYTGQGAVIALVEGYQVLIIAQKMRDLREVCRVFSPDTELDPAHVYPVGVIHRSMIATKSDLEEL